MRRSATRSEAEERTRARVRERYAEIATAGACGPSDGGGAGCCGSSGPCCCAGSAPSTLESGYSRRELARVPKGAELGLGCGNPSALAALRPGEVVLDLGSGAGVDCFLAAGRVGPRGRAIGVDMTPEMLARARENARKGGYANVEFRLGEIEHLPVADASVDAVLSNCVINLSTDKERVYREAFRVLREGGRLAVADVLATRRIAARDRRDASRWASCSSGALEVGKLRRLLERAGFRDVRIELSPPARAAGSRAAQTSLGVVPASILARKPAS